MKGRSRFGQRSAPSLPLVGRGRGGGVGADLSKAAPTPPSPTLPHKGGESRLAPSLDLVLLGEFGRAHGLKGEVRLKSFTADPMAIGSYGPLRATNGRMLTFKAVRPAPGSAPDLLIAVVEGVSTREAAEALNRVQLHIPREQLPAPDDEDEFLLADLIGLAAQAADGRVLGTVVAVPNYGSGDLLEIAPAGGGTSALLPFTKAFVPVIDIAARRVVVEAPDDLFEPAKPSPEDAA